MLRHHASEHVMIKIQIDGGAEESVLLKEVQHNAINGDAVHVDMQKVDMNKKLRVEVPVELVGEAEGVRNQGGVLDHLLHHVQIECFPADIPEQISVDVTALKLDETLTIKDIQSATAKYTILMDADIGVASVSLPKVVEEEPVAGDVAAAPATPEVIREKKPEEKAE
jgi:large subunit ribosomal protein L25